MYIQYVIHAPADKKATLALCVQSSPKVCVFSTFPTAIEPLQNMPTYVATCIYVRYVHRVYLHVKFENQYAWLKLLRQQRVVVMVTHPTPFHGLRSAVSVYTWIARSRPQVWVSWRYLLAAASWRCMGCEGCAEWDVRCVWLKRRGGKEENVEHPAQHALVWCSATHLGMDWGLLF